MPQSKGVGGLFGWLRDKVPAGERASWAPIRIPPGHASGTGSDLPIRAFEDYIGLRVNQLFLAAERRWFTEIEPAVFASVEFLYGGKDRTDAVVLGPQQDSALPPGTVLRNQQVFGVHPFRGGRITWTVVLSQVPVRNIARPILDLLQGAAGLAVPGMDLAAQANIGRLVLDGFERLAGLEGVKPLLGVRESIDVDQNDPLLPGHVALLAGAPPDPRRLWVRDSLLFEGETADSARPLVGRDFVLLEFTRAPDGRRSDVERLPFHADSERARESGGKPSDDSWAEAKALLAAAVSHVHRSPDLTERQKREINQSWTTLVKDARDEALRMTDWSEAQEATDSLDIARMQDVRAILDL
jgi:hypothetical protein